MTGSTSSLCVGFRSLWFLGRFRVPFLGLFKGKNGTLWLNSELLTIPFLVPLSPEIVPLMALFVLTVPFSVRFKLTVPFLGSFKEFRFWVCSASGMLSSTPSSLYTGICFVLPRRSPVSTTRPISCRCCKPASTVFLSISVASASAATDG